MSDGNHSEVSTTIEGYNFLAENGDTYEKSPWGDSHYQKHYVWPAVRSLLPEPEGTQVLDAGCGIGYYTNWFLENGANVVGVDASEQAIRAARNRFDDSTTFYCRDLTEQLDFASSGSFDLIFCNLVLDHIERWRPVFDEFHRILTGDGILVFTTIHPMRRYLRHEEELPSYYETKPVVGAWGKTDAQISSYHRPIGDIVNSLAEEGFVISEFREAIPQDSYKDYNPERYQRAMDQPDTLCVRAEATPPD